jgi:Bacterial regulatory helix-turn-helix proteins, AraC family
MLPLLSRISFGNPRLQDILQCQHIEVVGLLIPAQKPVGVTAPVHEPLRDNELPRSKLRGILKGKERSKFRGIRPGEIEGLSIESVLLLRSLRGNHSAWAIASGTPRPVWAQIARAVDLMQSCYRDELSLDDLARAAAMSRYHFLRSFKAHVGITPSDFKVERFV